MKTVTDFLQTPASIKKVICNASKKIDAQICRTFSGQIEQCKKALDEADAVVIGGIYSFPLTEKYWAWWSRYIMVNRYGDVPKPVYQNLPALVEEAWF